MQINVVYLSIKSYSHPILPLMHEFVFVQLLLKFTRTRELIRAFVEI